MDGGAGKRPSELVPVSHLTQGDDSVCHRGTDVSSHHDKDGRPHGQDWGGKGSNILATGIYIVQMKGTKEVNRWGKFIV